MTEETYMGVPRSKIPWYPNIDKQKCNLCDGDPQCLRFCPHGVFEYNKEKKEFIVKNPVKNQNNCVVFCRACQKACAADALSFPEKKEILKLIKNAREEKK
jgi:NAD-dependent dihydropyrimidine dehydrogenase PreA subunit